MRDEAACGVEDVKYVFGNDVTIEGNTVLRMEEFHSQVPDDLIVE